MLGLLVGLFLMVAVYRREGLTVLSFVPRSGDVIALWNAVKRLLKREPAVPVPPPCEPPPVVHKPSVSAPDRDRFLLRGHP